MGRPKFNPLSDIFSGILLAATSVPQLIAYAELVGYGSHRGLSTAGLPLAAWGMVTGHPYMNAGVTSMTALMAKSDLNGEAFAAENGVDEYIHVVAAYSFTIGVASIVLAVAGFGRVAMLIPKPVRKGFKWGSSLVVLVSALPSGLFNNGGQIKKILKASLPWIDSYKAYFGGGVNLAGIVCALVQPWTWAVPVTIIFVIGTWFIMEGSKTMLPKWLPPGTEVLIVPTIATLYSLYTDFEGDVVGEIPVMDADAGIILANGFIRIPVEVLDIKKVVFEMPAIMVEKCFSGSFLMMAVASTVYAGVGFLSIMGICAIFESEDDIGWSAERELVTQGVSCFVAAAVGSAPVSGSLSRSLISRMTGTTSAFACIVTALCWIYLQPYMGILSPTPKAALSAVIVSAVLKGVVIPKEMLELKGLDAANGWITGVATAMTSPTTGFTAGLVIYFILDVIFAGSTKQQIDKKKQ